MKNMINRSHIEGYLYEHDLQIKESGPQSKNPGTKYISGTISIATDEEKVNIVPVHFTYVTAITSTGKTNASYNTLFNIANGNIKTIMNGAETPVKIRVDSAIGLNEFYSNRNGTEEFISVKRNEGGFVHLVDILTEDEKKRNTFECDMIITGVIHKEEDPEKDIPEKAIIKGAIFDFRKSLLPIEFSAVNPNAIAYFEDLEVSKSNPVFTKLWGRQISEVVVKSIVEESAFGDPKVREVKNTRKDFIITGAASEPYGWDEEGILTVAELNNAITERETYLATLKQRNDEYNASKKANSNTTATATPATADFKF